RGPGRAVPCPRFPGTAAPSAPTGRVPRSSAIPLLGFPASFLTRCERGEVCVVDDTCEPHPLEARPSPTARPFRPGQDIVLSNEATEPHEPIEERVESRILCRKSGGEFAVIFEKPQRRPSPLAFFGKTCLELRLSRDRRIDMVRHGVFCLKPGESGFSQAPPEVQVLPPVGVISVVKRAYLFKALPRHRCVGGMQ